MPESLSFASVLVFLTVGIVFIAFVLVLSRLLHRWLHGRNMTPEKLTTYECGEDPVGDTRIKFNLRFYIIALIFLIFDVEIVLMFPWGVVFRNFPARGLAFLEMLFFAAILLVGLAYVWAKGDLEWLKTVPGPEAIASDQPQSDFASETETESD